MRHKFQQKKIFVIHSELDNYLIEDYLIKYFRDQWYGTNIREVETTFDIEYLDSTKGDYAGENFGKKIKKFIRECHYYLIIITKHSRFSQWVNQEIGAVYNTSMSRCLIMVEEDLKGESFGFIHSNIDIQYFTYGKFNFDKINNRIQKDFGEKREPANYGVVPYVV